MFISYTSNIFSFLKVKFKVKENLLALTTLINCLCPCCHKLMFSEPLGTGACLTTVATERKKKDNPASFCISLLGITDLANEIGI